VADNGITGEEASRQFNAMVGQGFSVAEYGITGEEAERNQKMR